MRVSSRIDTTQPVQKSQEKYGHFKEWLKILRISQAPRSGNVDLVTPREAFA